MHRLLLKVVSAFRFVLRGLATERRGLSRPEKALRGAALVPVFGALLVLLRLRALIAGPLEAEATTRDGARFRCRLPELIQMYLYLFGIWEPDITAFIRGRLSPGDVFVDVGAHVGYHTVLAARRVDGEGGVVAFEASPTIFRWLGENLALNDGGAGVRALNLAISDSRGNLRIYQGPQHNIGLSTTVGRRGFRLEADVAASPLSEALRPAEIARARLVKIDVEGGEDRVLAALGDFLARCRPDVEFLVELSPKWWGDRRQTPEQVIRVLLEAGFHPYRIRNNLWPWRYLWPNDVRRPRRVRDAMPRRVKHVELVLSREDREQL